MPKTTLIRTITAAMFHGPIATALRYGVGAAAIASVFTGIMPVHSESGPPLVVPGCAPSAAAKADTVSAAVPVADPGIPVPPITAQSAVVIDADTGRVLYGLGEHNRMPPASTTKIMTAILAIENGDPNHVVTSDIDSRTLVGSSVMGLRPGVQITEHDLLYGLMLPSGNDAAIELAEAIDGNVGKFVDRMNAKAAELGLRDTHFVNPHGLDDIQHYSSAYDLAALARYAMRNPTFAQLVDTQDYRLAPPSDYALHNGNSLLAKYPGADGVKIGWTDAAGWTFVGSATRNGHRLIVTVLNSKDRDADASALLDWAWASHHWQPVDAGTQQTLRVASLLGFDMPFMRALAVCS